MEQPTYLRRLKQQWVLLAVGGVVAIVGGLLAGFTIEDGQITPRAAQTFAASSNVLLSAPTPTQYQVEIPAETRTVTPEEAQQQAQQLIVQQSAPVDLESSAIILAYMAASDEIKDAVAAEVGGFADDEGLTAVRRTTQPGGDETFPGRLLLPIISITGIAGTAERAEEISQAATDRFAALVVAQQEERGVAEDIRIVLDEINAPVAGEPEGSNPAIPVVVVTLGIFLLFVAAALILGAVRDRRNGRRTGGSGEASADETPDDDSTDGEATDDEAFLEDPISEDPTPVEPARQPAHTRQPGRVRRARQPVGAVEGTDASQDDVPSADEVPVSSRS
jgi:hypothetical protein